MTEGENMLRAQQKG